MDTPCWIIHQPNGEGIVGKPDVPNVNMLFPDQLTAEAYLMCSLLFQQGFAVHYDPSAEKLIEAFKNDGQDGDWFEQGDGGFVYPYGFIGDNE